MAWLTRAAFWAVVAAVGALAACLLVVYIPWIDRPFPGFTVQSDCTVESQLPAHWTGTQAGLHALDRIDRVQGQTVTSGAMLDRIVKGLPVGTPLTYDLERFYPNGRHEPLTKTVATQRYAWADWVSFTFDYWLTGILFLVLGVCVSLLRPGSATARAHFGLCIAVGLMYLTIFDVHATYHMSSPWLYVPGRTAVGFFGAELAVRFFDLVLPERMLGFQAANLLLWLAINGFCLAYYPTDEWRWLTHFLPNLYAAIGLLYILGATIWVALLRTSTELQRAHARVIFWGGALTLVPGLAMLLPPLVGAAVPVYDLVPLSGLILPLTIAYAIVRHRLFEIDLFIQRTVTYAVLATCLTAVYLLILNIVSLVVGGQTPIGHFVTTVVVAWTYAQGRDRLRAWLDATFFRTTYRFDEVMASFVTASRDALASTALDAAFVNHVDVALAPSALALYQRDGDLTASLGEAAAQPSLPLPPPEVPAIARDPIDLGGLRAALVLPIRTRDATIGMALVGAKKSGLGYTVGDRRLLVALTDQLALCRELLERHEKAHQLHLQVEALARSQAMQVQFLNLVSHELRTPLAVVFGAVDLVAHATPADNAAAHLALRQIRASAGELLYLVNDLLDAGQLQAGTFRLAPRPFAFVDVLDDTLAELTPQADLKLQALVGDVAAALPTVEGDRQRLKQVVRNLVGNAVRYTDEGGSIAVRVAASGDRLRCEVADTGPGIADDQLPRLFQRFGVLDPVDASRPDGVGLGLFIAKALVEAHGGEIGVLSQVGVGSTFFFEVPFAAIDK
ncbi:MAG: hybrid sensor histidine kinase/response regulator [Cyanobacteria bacterium RYN_339]|nr:hybrid sensor histidine kinase/response regulator [Cyanobacteria bacterium RYN_339]